jgi:hypothetical protein
LAALQESISGTAKKQFGVRLQRIVQELVPVLDGLIGRFF